MNEQQIRDSASRVASELIVVAGHIDMREVRETVVNSIIDGHLYPFGTDATIKQSMQHAVIVARILALALGDALDELAARDD